MHHRAIGHVFGTTGWLPDLIRIAALVLFGTLAATTSRKVHLTCAVSYLLLLVWFVILYSPRLSAVRLLPSGA